MYTARIACQSERPRDSGKCLRQPTAGPPPPPESSFLSIAVLRVEAAWQVDVASQGETEEEALSNLREALELHFEPPGHPPAIRTVEVEVGTA